MLGFTFSIFLSGFAFGAPEDSPLFPKFLDYISAYSKIYADANDRLKRFENFQSNLKIIEEFNAKNTETQLGINQFADMTLDEFVKYLGEGNREPKKRGTRIQYSDNPGAQTQDGIDWTTKGAVTPMKNQRACGSCWAFSVTGALEGLYAIKTGRLRSFSEQQFVDCAGLEENVHGCHGGYPDPSFHYAEKHGICLEDGYPYNAVDQNCHLGQIVSKFHRSPNQCMLGIPPGEITGFYDIPEDSEAGLKAALDHQPVAVLIQARSFVFMLYKSGVLSCPSCGGESLDHAVLAVGYGETDSGQAYWKIKNSWGLKWGMNGYGLLARGIKDPKGQCGILQQASVPKFEKGEFDDNPVVGPPLEEASTSTDDEGELPVIRWVS